LHRGERAGAQQLAGLGDRQLMQRFARAHLTLP
jgi:hypothetical protein